MSSPSRPSLARSSLARPSLARPSGIPIALAGSACLILAMGIGRFAFTPMLPMMSDEGLLDVGGGGILASAHFLGYLAGALSAARLALPPRRTMVLALLVCVLGTLGMGLSDAFAVWLVLRAAVGIASAWVLVLVGGHLVRALAGDRRGAGWAFSGVGVGIVAAGLACLWFMLAGLASATGWLVLGAVSLLALGFLVPVLRGILPRDPLPAANPGTGRAPVDRPAVLAYGAMGVGYIVPATFLPLMARELVADPAVFGWSWPVFGAAAVVSTLAAARLSRRLGDRRLWAGCQGVMAVGLLAPVVLPGLGAIVLAGLCVGGTFMVITMAGLKEVHRTAPPGDAMRHVAVLTTAFAAGQVAGPLLAGWVHDLAGGFGPVLGATSALLALTAALLVLRPSPKEAFQP